MEMTLPCSEHQTVQDWYQKSEPMRRQLLAKESYAKHLVERRRRVHYSREFLRYLTNKDRAVLERVAAGECSLEQRFREQADKWERETQLLSSPTQRIMHPSYQAILGMGREVIPLLLRDMQQNRRPWFWALSYLTHENPINPKDAGRMDKMIEAWVKWTREKGLL